MASDLVEKLKKELDRHVVGFPGPRRDVAETLDQAAARITELEALVALIQEEAVKDNSPLGRSDSLALKRIRAALGAA